MVSSLCLCVFAGSCLVVFSLWRLRVFASSCLGIFVLPFFKAKTVPDVCTKGRQGA